MTQFIQAIYEQGVFRPLEPVALPEHERVSLTVAPVSSSGETAQDALKERRAAALRAALEDAARLPLEGAGLNDAEALRKQREALARMRAEMDALPSEAPRDGLGGADHDLILYGWKK